MEPVLWINDTGSIGKDDLVGIRSQNTFDTMAGGLHFGRYNCQLLPHKGIEKGALANALGPYLEDEMRRFNKFVTPEPLAHGGTRKIDRITGALQGRGERGRIVLLDAPWNEAFLTQCDDFPDPLAHDDILDAVAYTDQLAQPFYAGTLPDDEWQPMDLDAGI